MPREYFYPDTLKLWKSNPNKEAILFCCVQLDFPRLFKLLIPVPDPYLDLLAKNGSLECFKILDEFFDLSVPRQHALYEAISRGHNPVVEYLLNRGIEIDFDYRKDILEKVIRVGSISTFRRLYLPGSIFKQNCFDSALGANRPDFFEYFLDEFLPDQFVLNMHLYNAVMNQCSEIVEILLKRGAVLMDDPGTEIDPEIKTILEDQ